VRPVSAFHNIFLDRGYAPPPMEQAWGALTWALSVMRSRMWRDRLVPIGTYFNHNNNASQPQVISRLDEQVGVVLVTAGSSMAANAEVFDNYDKGAGYTDTASKGDGNGNNTPTRLCNTDLFMKYGFVQDIPSRHCLLIRVVIGANPVANAAGASAAEVANVELRYHHRDEQGERDGDMALELHMQKILSGLFDAFRRNAQVSLGGRVGEDVRSAEAEAEAVAVREKCVSWMVHETVRDALSTQDTAIPLDAFDILSKPMLRPYTKANRAAETDSDSAELETTDRRTWKSRPSVLESIEIIAQGSRLVKQQVLEYLSVARKKAFEQSSWPANERMWVQSHEELCAPKTKA